METINKKYKVTAQVLTPLSIGQGSENDWVYGVDYLVRTDPDDEKRLLLYHLDLGKIYAAGIDINRMSFLWANNDIVGIDRLIGNKLKSVSDFVLPLPYNIDRQGLKNPIKTFLRNDLTNHPILAGSSLKGALRSVLFKELREKDEQGNDRVLGSMTAGNDFMRFIRIGDFEFERTRLVNTKIFNLYKKNGQWQGGWKHSADNDDKEKAYSYDAIGFNTIYECLPPMATAEGSIMFADKLFDRIAEQPYRDKKNTIMHSPITEFCRIVNKHTDAYLDKEYAFFDKYEVDYTGNILNAIDDIQVVINDCVTQENHSCVLKMSAGSGFHSITGDWQFTDYTGNDGHTLGQGKKYHCDLPKSRKIAVSGTNPFSLMGFIKLTFTETK